MNILARPPSPPSLSQIASSSVTPSTILAHTTTTSATATATSQANTTATRTGPVVVFDTDFQSGTLESFWGTGGVDDSSISCKKLPRPENEDFQVSIVDDKTAPTSHGKALQLITNVNNKPGISFNSIIAAHTDFKDDSIYRAFGYFRKVRSQPETINVNIELTDNYVGYDCAFGWTLNRYDPDYGMVQVRTKRGVEQGIAIGRPWTFGETVHRLGDDETWHYFEIEGRYTSNPNSRSITNFVIDKSEYKIEQEMWSYQQPWPRNFSVGLETANMYVQCDTTQRSQGISRLCRLGLVRTSA
jgi:hypothetical protein